jgi:nucleotide-binding universal stress UspA family protein
MSAEEEQPRRRIQMAAEQRPVLVGVDGTQENEVAIGWAVAEAGSRHRPLRLVYAYSWPGYFRTLPMYPVVPEAEPAAVTRAAEDLLARVVRRTAALAPGVPVQGAAVEGLPALVLRAESELAEVVVLGSRHLHALGSAVLGSVGTGLAGRAGCPLVVVRGPAGYPAEGARVVAGVDGSEASEAVLGYAFDHACRYGVRLTAVLCWHPHPVSPAHWLSQAAAGAREHANAWLSEALAGWREKYPDVPVSRQVIDDHPVSGLVAESTGQHLLVVGARSRHGLAGALLGSVSQGVLHHATCPVAVVPVAG